MTTNEKVARRKLSMLELAAELNNVSKACRIMGYSRRDRRYGQIHSISSKDSTRLTSSGRANCATSGGPPSR